MVSSAHTEGAETADLLLGSSCGSPLLVCEFATWLHLIHEADQSGTQGSLDTSKPSEMANQGAQMTSMLLLLGLLGFLGEEPTPILVVNHRREPVSVAFSPDGKILAAGAGYTGIVFWDALTGKEKSRIDGDNVGDNIIFSPDGKILAAARNWRQGKEGGVVQLWEVATGKLRGQLEGDENLIRCAAFSPNGRLLAGHSQWGEERVGAVRVWDLTKEKELLHIPTNSIGHTIAFSPDGKLLAFDVRYTIRLCQAQTGKELLKLEGHQEVATGRGLTSGYLNAVAFSPDGKLLASASCDNTARLWDVATGKAVQVLEGHQGFVNCVAFFPACKTLATGGEDGTIRCWDLNTGRQLSVLQAHGRGKRDDGDERQNVFALCFSPDGNRLASGGQDTTVKVWEVEAILKSRPPQ